MKRTAKVMMVNGQAQTVWDPPFTPEQEAGHKHNVREMLDTGQGPLLKTNTRFLAAFGDNGKQFENEPEVGDYYRGLALANGVDPKGKVYLSGLARFPGDPESWVSDRDEALRRAESRGWGAEMDGVTKVAPREAPPPAPVGLAPEVINDRINAALLSVADPRDVNMDDLREKVIQDCTPDWSGPTEASISEHAEAILSGKDSRFTERVD